MEELMDGQTDSTCASTLQMFARAHMCTGTRTHALAAARLLRRRIDLLSKMQRFRDMGKVMCDLAETLQIAEQPHEAARCLERARAVGEEHGFFSVECRACKGLGDLAITEGRNDDAVQLLQNALAAVQPLNPRT